LCGEGNPHRQKNQKKRGGSWRGQQLKQKGLLSNIGQDVGIQTNQTGSIKKQLDEAWTKASIV